MQLSIIIVNYNVRYFLEQCLLSVQFALRGIDGEIIVVDNVSNDASCSMVKEKFPDVNLIENKENVGFSKANNQGVALSKGKYVLILNPDTIVSEDSFAKILAFAEKKKDLGILGVKFIDGTGNFLPESKRGLPTPRVAFNKMFGILSSSKGRYYATHLNEDEIGKIDILSGAFMLIEKSKYLDVNGFDETYFMFGEDIDLSYKMLKKGHKNYYYPAVQIIHYKGESTVKDSKYLRNFYGAMRVFHKKHYATNKVFNFGIGIGIKLLHFINIFQHTQKKTTSKIPRNVLYIGNDNSIYEALRKQYSKSTVHLFAVCNTRVISRYDDLEKIENEIDKKQIDEIVFDNQSNTFSKIIFYMTSLKNKGTFFKIHPKNCDFIIGSNDKNAKGEIILL